MKITSKIKNSLFRVAIGCLIWAASALLGSLLFPHRSFLYALTVGPSDDGLAFRSWFLAGLVLLGILAGLFALRAKNIVAAYKRSEEQFENLVKMSGDIITITDRDGNVVFINDAACRILERKREEVIGKSFLTFLYADDRKMFQGKLAELVKARTDAVAVEHRFIARSGRVINTIHTIRVLIDKEGKSAGTLGIARDLTEGKQSEASLQTALAQIQDDKATLESALATIDAGVSVQDRDFKLLYHNQAYLRIFGGDAGRDHCYEACNHSDLLCPDCPLEETFRDGNVHRIEKEISHNGEIRFIEITASPLKNASGDITAGLEEVRDITARKQAEKAMEQNHNQLMLLVEERTRELTNENENLRREIEDRDKAEKAMQQNHDQLMLLVDERTRELSIANENLQKEIEDRSKAEKAMQQNHDQLMHLVEERTGELARANENLSKEAADREVMEQELLKARKRELLGVLATGVAHDFNSLLASIAGNISLALPDTDSKTSSYHQLEEAKKASLRAQDLALQMLALSKGEGPDKKAVAIGDLVREAADAAKLGPRIKFFYSLPEGLWLVDIDETEISQVIHTLIMNADDAMPRGGTITISCENIDVAEPLNLPLKPGKYVRTNIRDHGAGIPQKYLSNIFDPYFTAKQRGSGLGLALAYSIINRHNGHILAESEPGKGATFIIYLPAYEAAIVQKGSKG